MSGWLHKKGIEIYPGTIKFKNHYDANGNPDGIECDVDNGEDQEENGRANYFTPCIYPEKRQIPHTNPQPDDK